MRSAIRPSIGVMATAVIQHSAAKFIVVGLANNAAGYAIFVVLSLMGVGALPAMTASYVVGMGISFTANRRWTFSHNGNVGPALLRFFCVNAVGYSLNFFLLSIFVGVLSWPQIPVQLGAIALVAVTTFILMRLWVFRATREPSHD